MGMRIGKDSSQPTDKTSFCVGNRLPSVTMYFHDCFEDMSGQALSVPQVHKGFYPFQKLLHEQRFLRALQYNLPDDSIFLLIQRQVLLPTQRLFSEVLQGLHLISEEICLQSCYKTGKLNVLYQ